MVIDTSAVVAILRAEPERPRLLHALTQSSTRMIATPSALEASMVLSRSWPDSFEVEVDRFCAEAGVEIVSFTATHLRIARAAFRRFGKGRHEAALNFGDCMSYALSVATGEPLLFKGTDFAATDIAVARW